MSFIAKFRGQCDDCEEPIVPGEEIAYRYGDPHARPLVHVKCPDKEPAGLRPGEVSCPDCFLIHPAGACDL